MKYRRFGRTGIDMPVFSCGGMRYQSKWADAVPSEIPAEDQANVEATIRRAWELGINHFETARSYGTSEMQLGRVLGELDRDKLIVQTKIAPSADPEEFDRKFDKSMDCLKLEYVDLLSLHGINNAEILDWSIQPGGCLERALRMKEQGRVRHIGFSTHGSCAEILQTIETGLFEYINIHWYFVNDFNWSAVQAAARRDMGVFIISPTDKGGMLYAPPEKLTRLCAPFSPIMFNDLYCLARPEVHTLSIGAARPSDFDEHVRALEYYDQIADIIDPIEQRLRAEMAHVLGAEWEGDWWSNLPEHYDAPGGINLREILRLWSLARSLDLVEFGKMRYNLLGNIGHWLPGTNAASFERAAVRSSVAGSALADRIPDILSETHEMLIGEKQQRLTQSE